MNSNLHTHEEATLKIISGINKVADAIKLTIGAAGTNAILEEDLNPGYIITNDGFSILERTQFEDPLEEIGRRILMDSVSRANKQSGDGSTTTTILTQAILNEGVKAGISGMQIKRALEEVLPTIEQAIDAQKKVITPEEVHAVATISAEDPDMGKIIGEIYQQIGAEGIIELDNSKTFDTYFQVKEGVRFQGSVISPFLYNKGNKAELTNPNILFVEGKITSAADVASFIDRLPSGTKKELVIFCDEITDAVSTNLIMNHVKGKYSFLIIKAPTIWKQFVFEDVAKATGANIVSDRTGLSLKNVQLSDLGTCQRIIADREEMTLIGIKDVSDHIKTLKDNGDDDSLRRVAWLNTKAAVLYLGANSDSDLSYKRLKTEDAINAARLALEDGVVPGGGVALVRATLSLDDSFGGKILKRALMAPMLQIIENSSIEKMSGGGVTGESIVEECMASGEGFDANKMEIVNMWEADIIDPAKTLKNAVRNAISVASTALTIRIAVHKNRTEEEIARKFIMRQQGQF
jgi:chaperonin GroEL